MKSTNANNNYSGFIKTFYANILKGASYETVDEGIYKESIKSSCIDNIKKIFIKQRSQQLDNNAPYELDQLFEHYEYYEPILTRRSFEESYVKYTCPGDFTSSIGGYFENIKFYLSKLIYYYMLKCE